MRLQFHRPVDQVLGAAENSLDQHRGLDENSYLVDSDGNAYQPYSLAWRFLGLFIDCNENRRLEDGDAYCQRNVLWAAYNDEKYTGNSIGEYSFFDRSKDSWDSSTCRPKWNPFKRCQRLNCHEAGTHFKLVGVFKETEGMYDFTEQLFKHQGYCLWDGDKEEDESGDSGSQDNDDYDQTTSDYNFMQNLQANWIYECTELNYYDEDGNALYVDTKPQPGGTMTYGVYTDASCSTESTLTWADVVSKINNNGDNEYITTDSIDRWNDLLSDYKICQPCRAYNRVRTWDGSHDSDDSGSDDEEDGDDGEGAKERWGFNCYDDAGYQNCNQCYKFETQTNMQLASTEDLELATAQGTILAVTVDGERYGKSYYHAPGHTKHVIINILIALVSAAAVIGLAYFYYIKIWKRRLAESRNKGDGVWYELWTNKKSDTSSSAGSDESASSGEAHIDKQVLLDQIRMRDDKLAQQDKLIRKLKRKLASYKK